MFRALLALLALSTSALASTTSTYFTFDYRMPDLPYVEGEYGTAGDAFPGFGMTLFIQFDQPVSLLPNGTYSSDMPGVYIDLPEVFDWNFQDFAVEVFGPFIASWTVHLGYEDGTGSSFVSLNGQDRVSIEPDTLFVSQSAGTWSSVASRQACYDTNLNLPCSPVPPPGPQEVPLPAPAFLLLGAAALLIRRRS